MDTIQSLIDLVDSGQSPMPLLNKEDIRTELRILLVDPEAAQVHGDIVASKKSKFPKSSVSLRGKVITQGLGKLTDEELLSVVFDKDVGTVAQEIHRTIERCKILSNYWWDSLQQTMQDLR